MPTYSHEEIYQIVKQIKYTRDVQAFTILCKHLEEEKYGYSLVALQFMREWIDDCRKEVFKLR